MNSDRVSAGHYEDLEPGKWVRVSSWVDAGDAKSEILPSAARYQTATPKPRF
jgi:inorganic pyrophosphatase